MGADPPMDTCGLCTVCGRTEAEIVADHGTFTVTQVEREQRKDSAITHMMGVEIRYVPETE